jgi:hypothetical protein
MSIRNNILFPVGRLVQGSVYRPSTTDNEGRPLVVKSGPNAGQTRVDYFLAVAIAKQAGHTHFAQTDWGRIIWDTAVAAFPQGQAQAPTFAFKVKDGDSTMPNKAGKRPCDQEGWPGHWVVMMSSGYASKVYTADGSQQIVEADAVKCGYFIQIAGSVAGNESLQQPGVFINHNMVALAGYGPEIISGPDPRAVGFGGGPLPAGMSAAPLGGGFNPAAPVAGAPGALPPGFPANPAAAVLPPARPPVMPPAMPAPVAPIAVQPNPAFLGVPGLASAMPAGVPMPPGLPTMPPAAPAAPQRRMLPPANGASYEQMIANGWTDALLLQHGMMAV